MMFFSFGGLCLLYHITTKGVRATDELTFLFNVVDCHQTIGDHGAKS
jgi:hypothetical protein